VPTDIVLTDKTRETMTTLLQAARTIFESEGFDGASINQIVDRAGVARGTFYIYFPSKEDILETIAEGIDADIQAIQVGIDDPTVDSPERADELIRRSIRQFLRFYREHARMMAVLEQVATHDDRFRLLRRRMRRSAATRAIGLIDRLKEHGLVVPELDARYAAVALTGMVDRFAFVWFVLEEEFEEDTAVDVLARLWLQAVTGAPSPGGDVDADVSG
jgi:AcrR family transcriptional regulator